MVGRSLKHGSGQKPNHGLANKIWKSNPRKQFGERTKTLIIAEGIERDLSKT